MCIISKALDSKCEIWGLWVSEMPSSKCVKIKSNEIFLCIRVLFAHNNTNFITEVYILCWYSPVFFVTTIALNCMLGFIFRILLLSSILIDAFLNYTRFISSEFYALFFDICLGTIYLKDIVCDSCSVTFDSLWPHWL